MRCHQLESVNTPRETSPSIQASAQPAASQGWRLRLYIAGLTPKSLAAFANLKEICDRHLPGAYEIELVDLLEKPWLAKIDQIIAIPTLVRTAPGPVKKMIGDLSVEQRVVERLNLPAAPG